MVSAVCQKSSMGYSKQVGTVVQSNENRIYKCVQCTKICVAEVSYPEHTISTIKNMMMEVSCFKDVFFSRDREADHSQWEGGWS